MRSSCVAAALVALVALSSSIQASEVPVFIWGKPSVTYVPALSQYSAPEFAALLGAQADEQTFTIVFAEERLSTEDLAGCKLNTQTCFRNLAKVQRKSYLPSVEEPLSALLGASESEIQSVQLRSDGELSERIVPRGGSIVIVNLSGDDFASHDALIDGLYNRLRAEFPNIVAVYTGKTPSFRYSTLVRKARQAEPEQPEAKRNVIYLNDTFLFSYEKFQAGPVGSELTAYSLESAVKVDADSSATTLKVEVRGSGSTLTFAFELGQGNWAVTGVTYNNIAYYLRHVISINQHFSYHCNDLQYYTPDMKNVIVLSEVQMQPFWPAEGQEIVGFGDAWDCVGFTSPGILTGLFIVFLFLWIGGYGVTWMMDIRTMDRFDDPKGKTITVNTAAD